MRRVVVTGMGVVSPLGCTLDSFWENISAGKSGIRRIDKFDASRFGAQIAGQVVGFDADAFVAKKEQRRLDMYSVYAMAGAKLAVSDSGLETDPATSHRMGVIVARASGVFGPWKSSTRSWWTGGRPGVRPS